MPKDAVTDSASLPPSRAYAYALLAAALLFAGLVVRFVCGAPPGPEGGLSDDSASIARSAGPTTSGPPTAPGGAADGMAAWAPWDSGANRAGDGTQEAGLEASAVEDVGDLRRAVPAGDAGAGAVVSGTVRARGGEPLSGQTVELSSKLLQTRDLATTDESGAFSISGVKLGSPYRLSIEPEATYQDYHQDDLVVTGDSLSLDIVLEPLTRGRLAGRMVDVYGNPIPGLSLRLQSSQAAAESLEVAGNGEGYFIVDDVPTGELRFTTHTVPNLMFRGITLPPRLDKEILLVLDWGDHALRGRIVDERGNAVAGAQLKLSWWHRPSEGISSSSRTTVTDESGSFEFPQLGPGSHVLSVHASGYQDARESHEIFGSEWVEVQLERGSAG